MDDGVVVFRCLRLGHAPIMGEAIHAGEESPDPGGHALKCQFALIPVICHARSIRSDGKGGIRFLDEP